MLFVLMRLLQVGTLMRGWSCVCAAGEEARCRSVSSVDQDLSAFFFLFLVVVFKLWRDRSIREQTVCSICVLVLIYRFPRVTGESVFV